MKEEKLVRPIALVIGLLFLLLFYLVCGPLASSPAETGPLHALSRFFHPGLKADPAQALTGTVVRVALGVFALCWLAVAAIPRGTADATIRAALRPGSHRRRALLALVLGGHATGLGALLLFVSHGGTPKWLSEVFALGVPGFLLSLLPRALGLLACIRLLWGLQRAPYDYFLGAFAALGSGIALILGLRSIMAGADVAPVLDLILRLIGQILFPALSIWAGILLARGTLPLPGRIQSRSLAAYTVASGITLTVAMGHVFDIGSIFRFAPSVAWMDALISLAFLAVAAACLLHAAAMATTAPSQAAPASPAPEIAMVPEPISSELAPKEAAVVPKQADAPVPPMPSPRPSLGWIVDAVLGFVCSGLLSALAMYALTKMVPVGVLVYAPLAAVFSVGGFVVILVGIVSRRFGALLGGALFEIVFWLFFAR